MYSIYIQLLKIGVRDRALSNGVECIDWKEVEIEDDGD